MARQYASRPEDRLFTQQGRYVLRLWEQRARAIDGIDA
jgi:hypothetical protein